MWSPWRSSSDEDAVIDLTERLAPYSGADVAPDRGGATWPALLPRPRLKPRVLDELLARSAGPDPDRTPFLDSGP